MKPVSILAVGLCVAALLDAVLGGASPEVVALVAVAFAVLSLHDRG